MNEAISKQILLEHEEAQVRERIRKMPEAQTPRVRLALHCWRSGLLSEALEWVDACLELDSTNVDYYRIRANVLIDMRLSAQAVETAERAIRAVPDSVTAWMLAARMRLIDLQPARAQIALDRALELDPEHGHVEFMKSLQEQILNMKRESEHNPLKWIGKKIKKRMDNVAGEKKITG